MLVCTRAASELSVLVLPKYPNGTQAKGNPPRLLQRVSHVKSEAFGGLRL